MSSISFPIKIIDGEDIGVGPRSPLISITFDGDTVLLADSDMVVEIEILVDFVFDCDIDIDELCDDDKLILLDGETELVCVFDGERLIVGEYDDDSVPDGLGVAVGVVVKNIELLTVFDCDGGGVLEFVSLEDLDGEIVFDDVLVFDVDNDFEWEDDRDFDKDGDVEIFGEAPGILPLLLGEGDALIDIDAVRDDDGVPDFVLVAEGVFEIVCDVDCDIVGEGDILLEDDSLCVTVLVFEGLSDIDEELVVDAEIEGDFVVERVLVVVLVFEGEIELVREGDTPKDSDGVEDEVTLGVNDGDGELEAVADGDGVRLGVAEFDIDDVVLAVGDGVTVCEGEGVGNTSKWKSIEIVSLAPILSWTTYEIV